MSSQTLNNSLLKTPILHILRAAGFHSARPAALDTLVDLTSRYLALLVSSTAAHALTNHNDFTPTVLDVRMAMQDVGALRPQLSMMEEQRTDIEDMRGLQVFLDWLQGDGNAELRRIAGLAKEDGDVVDVEVGTEREDFLTALKKKHSKTGEESRFQGTVLGIGAEEKPLRIEGGDEESIVAWEAAYRAQSRSPMSNSSRKSSSAPLSSMGSPLSDIGDS